MRRLTPVLVAVLVAVLLAGCVSVARVNNETCYATTPPLARVHPWFWWLNPFAAIPLHLEGGFDGTTQYCEQFVP